MQTLPSHAFTREKSSEQTSCAIASAIGSSKAFGVLQRRRGRHSRPETAGRILHSGDLATIAPYPSSRSSTLFNGSSKLSAFAVKGRPLWESTKPRNHSRRARARAATASSSPGKAFARIVSLWLGSISLACTSHAKRSFSVGNPLDNRIYWCPNRVKEIESKVIRDEHWRRTLLRYFRLTSVGFLDAFLHNWRMEDTIQLYPLKSPLTGYGGQ